MKTIFLAFSIRKSSVSEYFIALANELAQDNKVVIFTDYFGEHDFFIMPEIKILKWPGHPKSLKSFYFLSSHIRKRKPEIMIANFSAVGTFLLVGYIYRVKKRIPWCHSISEQFLEVRPRFDKKKLVYALATSIIANSRATRKDLVQTFGINKRKISVFHNALKDPHINLPMDPLQITFAGRLDKAKGVDVLLNAMPMVIREFPEIQLKIIGTGSQLQNLIDISKLLGLGRNVNFVGAKSRDYVLAEFSRSNITVVPSKVEAFGYVVIESFAVKTPVIGSDTSGIAEIIRSGSDGLLFDNRNSKHLAEHILTLLENPELRERMSNSCYLRFIDKFELGQTIRNISAHLLDKPVEEEKLP